MIKVYARDGLAKSGEFESLLLKFSFPALVSIQNADIKTELGLTVKSEKIYLNDVELPYQKLTEPDYLKVNEDIILVPGLSHNLTSVRELVNKVMSVREKLGFNKLIYAPFLGTPLQIPALVYLGIDILDFSYIILESAKNVKYTRFGTVYENDSLNSNIQLAQQIMQETKESINRSKIREYVESLNDYLSKKIIRELDFKYFEKTEPFYPVWKESLNAIHLDALFRPDIIRYQKRVKERFKKPERYNALLLLPCSAKKPYSLSKSHRFFRTVMDQTGKMVHEVILTSPLGLVPRELERIYPAQNYDIPVTGHWFEDEKHLIKTMLYDYLSVNNYEHIIAYLPEDLSFVSDILERFNAVQIYGDLRSINNVKLLQDTLNKIEAPNISYRYRMKEEIRAIMRYQFGNVFDSVFDKFSFKGRYPNINIEYKNEHMFHYNAFKGMLNLSLATANILFSENKYIVEIEDFEPKGSIFAVGVLNATSDIRKEDEVIVVRKGSLIGVGTAKMNYIDLMQLEYGEAVKLKHIKK